MRVQASIGRLWRSLSATGLVVGVLFFAVSLTPSLVPRPFVLQALLSGIALAAGYGVGAFLRWLWGYVELPVPRQRVQEILQWPLAALSLGVALVFLLQATAWQNSVRERMAMEPVEGVHLLGFGAAALLLFALLLLAARMFRFVARTLARRFSHVAPRKISNVLGVLIAVLLFWALIDGLVTRVVLGTFDASFQQLDALIEPETDPPQHAMTTGSEASLVPWQELGRQGRRFVAGGPAQQSLEGFFGTEVVVPVRVYVGLNAAETIDERVALALDELKRTSAFERSVLVIITPTGTGWVDPGAIDSLEYLHRGDVASVAVQYSYLPSWLTLLAQPEYGAETARELFQAIYRHWTDLPADQRPRLYLHGLSLGALNSQRSVDIWDIVGDPVHGALWSGPPFRSSTWRWVTDHRKPGTPAWLPRFRDGSVVRFSNQYVPPERFAADWGPLRIVYLQYASDPITFFEPESLFRAPEWMAEPRGPDVSPSLRWFPVVTLLQLAADIFAADKAPIGYGHRYATEHYIDAWREVSAPPNWTETGIQRLKSHIGDLPAAARGEAAQRP
ncbi:alpha/beta hydrolase [Thioalkalivibrio paradoxus]|uniref:Membrane protein n=1 Tax=Thioalkalivibrio paradoxus ARh 1 TaxID=713585 RepID=W0DQ13_9GAMM|nr:alpha/beta-hydrolase family protein [Thioalkalivibrio paradoxus]AHE98965.1 membrane protein [Thioalkalivibrio paradoxus ARh 1]